MKPTDKEWPKCEYCGKPMLFAGWGFICYCGNRPNAEEERRKYREEQANKIDNKKQE